MNMRIWIFSGACGTRQNLLRKVYGAVISEEQWREAILKEMIVRSITHLLHTCSYQIFPLNPFFMVFLWSLFNPCVSTAVSKRLEHLRSASIRRKTWRRSMHSWHQQLEGVRSSESAAGRHRGHTVPLVCCGAAGGLQWLVQVPAIKAKPLATGCTRWSTDRTHVPAGHRDHCTLLPRSWRLWVWARGQVGGVRTMQRGGKWGWRLRQVGEFICVC